ncbi:MAG: hypothetical protein CMJ29_03190 [Phycisphaerae bacterium]|nr:hypothetical protein [Phycisphaerae bacterium]
MSILFLSLVLLSSSEPQSDLSNRLEMLVEELEEARVDYKVPGMTLGVVKDGEIILVEAFGTRDLATGEPMTVDTLLPIGSSTKAFTATAIGMLDDDGVLDWDDPVREHLPQLDLQIKSLDETDEATIRDLLSHRTGFPRMGILWAGKPATDEQIFQAASRAVPQADFRSQFLYNNVMYLGAGEASARVAGMPWHELIEARILKPLGMNQTEVTSEGAVGSGRLGLGYMWNTDSETYDLQEFREIDTCAPAGSICSTPRDMARWVQFQLENGLVEGQALISEDALKQTRTPQIQMMPEMDYGLGWMLEEWQGKKLIQHGGNIDGYSSTVAFIPEENVGFCLLMNSMPTAMQEACKSMVWEALLLDAETGERPVADDLDRYTGSFTANFASFNDAIMEVTAVDGTLFLDVPGQMNFELVPPQEGEEKWPFRMTDTIAVSFHEDESGDINLMKMYQAGVTFELPRKGQELPQGPFEESQVRKWLGTYEQTSEPTAGRIDEVKLENGWLMIDVPQQMAFKLNPPDEEGKLAFRDIDGLALSFTEKEDGAVNELIIYQNGMTFPGKRVGDAITGMNEDSLPSLEDIIALRNASWTVELAAGEAIEINGEMLIPPSGIEGDFEIVMAGPEQMRVHTGFGAFGDIDLALNGDYAAEVGDFYQDRRLDGTELELVQLGQGLLSGSWEMLFDDLEVSGWSEIDDVRCVKVEATTETLDQPFILHVDPENGLLRKADIWIYAPNLGPYPMELHIGDMKQFGDMTWPETWWMYDEATGEVRYNTESVKRLKSIPGNQFELAEFPADQEGS